MAIWINRGTNEIEIETFGAEKRGNRNNEFNQKIRIFGKLKDVLPFSIFADQDDSQRAKY